MVRALLQGATHAALSFHDPNDGRPGISRIAFALDENGVALSLMSDLAVHAAALQADPRCALLIGEPGSRGDPLTHPRLSLSAEARFVRHGTSEHSPLAEAYLRQRPKSKLYIGFADFSIVVFRPLGGVLNGGFGKAFQLTAADVSI